MTGCQTAILCLYADIRYKTGEAGGRSFLSALPGFHGHRQIFQKCRMYFQDIKIIGHSAISFTLVSLPSVLKETTISPFPAARIAARTRPS